MFQVKLGQVRQDNHGLGEGDDAGVGDGIGLKVKEGHVHAGLKGIGEEDSSSRREGDVGESEVGQREA